MLGDFRAKWNMLLGLADPCLCATVLDVQVDISDVAIFMVDGVFQWPELVSSSSSNTSSELEKSLSQSSVVIPVLRRCGAQSNIQIARGKSHGWVVWTTTGLRI